MTLRLHAADDLVRPAEGDEVQPREEDRRQQDRGLDRLTERGPDAVTAGDDRDADPQQRPNSECQPVRPPGLHGLLLLPSGSLSTSVDHRTGPCAPPSMRVKTRPTGEE